MKYKNYTEDEFIEAVKTSISKRQVLIKLGLAPQGGNYKTVDNLVKKLGLDTSHFKGKRQSEGKKFGPKRPIEAYLSNKFGISSYNLKNRLIKENIFSKECFNCKRNKWQNKPIPLELDHIDGNNKNNNLNNLRLLCPNCHALTPTYRGRNKGK